MALETATTDLEEALARLPRTALGTFPTPLDPAPRLSARLGVQILVKRDDLTGLALGGNKVRKLEFLIGAALARGADTIVTTGGSQSNHARLTAAACRRYGLDALLILDRGVHPERQGNLLLDRLFGAEVRLIESNDPAVAAEEMRQAAEEMERQGRAPYVIPRGGSVPTGAAGYAAFTIELREQVQAAGLKASHLYLATGSTGTHAGVLAGVLALGWDITVQGISVSRPADQQVAQVRVLTEGVLDHLGLDLAVPPDAVHVDDAYRGPGYGIPTAGTMRALTIAARDEALVLDPVYTGKAMAGLIARAERRRFSPDDTVIFLHTGGTPGLFAYHHEVSEALDVEP